MTDDITARKGAEITRFRETVEKQEIRKGVVRKKGSTKGEDYSRSRKTKWKSMQDEYVGKAASLPADLSP